MVYRPEIDGLRAIAVLPVIFFHAGLPGFRGGFVGVDVFFIISGYLITTNLLTDLTRGEFSIVHFYERRIRRLIPALFVMLTTTSLLAWFFLNPKYMSEYSKSLIGVCLFVSNIFFWRSSGYFDASTDLKPLLHTWSLSLEEQFYVFFPLVLWVIWRKARRWISHLLALGLFSSLMLAQWASVVAPSANFYLLPTRSWELLLGALLGIFIFNHPKMAVSSWLSSCLEFFGLILITYAVLKFDESTPNPSFMTLIPTLGAALIILFTRQSSLLGKNLSSRIVVAIGISSYSS